MTEDRFETRMRIRRTIHAAGHEFCESISNRTLQNIAGELMGLNEEACLNYPGTVAEDHILKSGFTDNQKRWLEILNKELTGCGNDR